MLGYPEAATAAATEAVALEPYREHAYLQLIRAQAAAGNRAEALHTYERCRRLLAEELGVSPSPQTEAAYLAALGSESEASPARASVANPRRARRRARDALRPRRRRLHRLPRARCRLAGPAGVLQRDAAHRLRGRGAGARPVPSSARVVPPTDPLRPAGRRALRLRGAVEPADARAMDERRLGRHGCRGLAPGRGPRAPGRVAGGHLVGRHASRSGQQPDHRQRHGSDSRRGRLSGGRSAGSCSTSSSTSTSSPTPSTADTTRSTSSRRPSRATTPFARGGRGREIGVPDRRRPS